MACNTVLELRKGVQVIPTDTQSAEQGIDRINLLDPEGFIVDSFTQQYPALKGSAIFADAPQTPGRTFIAGEDGHVIEKLDVTLSAPDMQTLGVKLSHMMQFRQDVRDFWSNASIEPVYLVHQTEGEPGKRYAQISNLEIALKDEPVEDNGRYIRDFALTIEREPYWRGDVAPGATPKWWTFRNETNPPVLDYWSLYEHGANFHLALENISARSEMNPADYVTRLSKNYVEIPAASIPGDAPALVYVSIEQQGNAVTASLICDKIYVGRKSGVFQLSNHESPADTFAQILSLNAADGGTSYVKTNASDGLFSNGSAVTRYYVTAAALPTTFGGINTVLRWGNQATSLLPLDMNAMRGRYMAILRMRRSGGAAGDLDVRLKYAVGGSGITNFITLPTIVQPAVGVAATDWNAYTMGILTIPPNNVPLNSIEGYGLETDDSTSRNALSIEVEARKPSGASAAALHLLDLTLIPIDESAVALVNDQSGGGLTAADDYGIYTIDSTGYMTRGKQQQTAWFDSIDGGLRQGLSSPNELRGNGLTLQPKRDNRLYFFFNNNNKSQQIKDYTIRVNIVPRWTGIRDE